MMISKTTPSIPASLALFLILLSLVSAAPFARDDQAGTAISLPDRMSPTNPDGTFNLERATRLNRRAESKHRQRFPLQNSGEGSEGQLPQGTQSQSPSSTGQTSVNTRDIHVRDDSNDTDTGNTDTDDVAGTDGNVKLPGAGNVKVSNDKPQKSQEEGLTDEEGDVEWAGNIKIGSSKKRYLIDFDTGSSDLWVVSKSCTDPACAKKQKYDAGSSKTSKIESGNFTIEYGDGSTASGPIYSDTVIVAGITVKDQKFSAVTKESQSFASDPIDGILGLAFPKISNLKAKPWFLKAFEEGSIKTKEFGMYLSAKGSELYLGGTDQKLYKGSLEYHKVDTSDGFWDVEDASIHVGGNKALKGFKTVIDSGTTLMYGPPKMVKEVFQKIPEAKIYNAEEGFWSVPCDKIPELAFSWGQGKKFVVPSENLNLGTIEKGSSRCVLALAASNLGLGKSWLIGDSFMKGVYCGFRFGEHDVTEGAAVGFAESKKKV